MSRLVVNVEGGPVVEVCANVTLEGSMVGLIAMPKHGRGWVELTPAQAEAVGSALVRAARETRGGR